MGNRKENKPDKEQNKYDIIYIDPPWPMTGDPNKMAAAGKHYHLMTMEDINRMPLKSILKKNGAVFVWATTPRLNLAFEAIKSWDLHYRGIAHIWVKTRKSDNAIINGQGVPPTYSKPTTEVLLLATTKKSGRPIPLVDCALPQVVLAPREGHSVKPQVFRTLIERAFNNQDLKKIEIFSRKTDLIGWDVAGNAVDGKDINQTLEEMINQ
jgi:N6-adenosine-specific RNA methylase IME4